MNSILTLILRRGRQVLLAVSWALLVGTQGGTIFSAAADWNLIWNDEFNGNSLNSSHWTFDIGNGPPGLPGWGNGELEYYTSRAANVYVASGTLHLVARKESYAGFDYTSARLKTQGLFTKTYGRFEYRAKLPQGQGYWPALWLMPADPIYGAWAASGETDVMENRGSNSVTVFGTIHFGGTWPDNTQSFGPAYVFSNGDSVTNFHVYALEWTTNAFRWYVDGHLYQTQTSWWSSGGLYPAPFNRPFYLLMNLAVGGRFGGDPDGTTVFPGEMEVDYVRVYDSTAPFRITVSKNDQGQFLMSWPANIVCHLQQQINSTGIAGDWLDVPNASNPYLVLPATNGDAVFYRLTSP